jgi:hypothetical protein
VMSCLLTGHISHALITQQEGTTHWQEAKHITPTAPALIDATVEGEEGDAKPSYWGTITDGDNTYYHIVVWRHWYIM